MGQTDEALLRELHAGLAVVRSQQTEINRRLGAIEEDIKEGLDPSRVTSIEAALASRNVWVTWVVQTFGSIIVITLMVYLARLLGFELAF